MEIQVGTINALFQEDQCPRMMKLTPGYLQRKGEEGIHGTYGNLMLSCLR